jgi:hypothetical protein
MTAKTAKKTANDTPKQPLDEFMANINKKDGKNGLKITFGFSKRKRK